MNRPQRNSLDLIDLQPVLADFREEVLGGLRKPQKELSAKFFYDRRGSELFEEITALPEYYLTRTEISILDEYAEEIVGLMGDDFALIEYGSGSSRKVRILLDQLNGHATYMPIDISMLYLRESAELLSNSYPEISVVAVCADYTVPFEIPRCDSYAKRVVFFPGSTVGNLEPTLAKRFFRNTARSLKPGDGMLIGVDLQKDTSVLDAAYNDSRGVTAEFNLNILRRINKDLAADFNIAQFQHVAFYNEKEGRVEMHLRSRKRQTVSIDGEAIEFNPGETIHTENSYKYTIEGFQSLLVGSGFIPLKVWTDSKKMFSVQYLTVDASGDVE